MLAFFWVDSIRRRMGAGRPRSAPASGAAQDLIGPRRADGRRPGRWGSSIPPGGSIVVVVAVAATRVGAARGIPPVMPAVAFAAPAVAVTGIGARLARGSQGGPGQSSREAQNSQQAHQGESPPANRSLRHRT